MTTGSDGRTHHADVSWDRVTVHYPGQAQPALQAVSVHTTPGAITAVVGPNGSGKSTLVRALLRRTALAAGTIRIGERALGTMDARELARLVAIVPQREEPTLPLTVRELVLLGRHPHRGTFGAPSSRDRQAVDDALHRTGVAPLAERRTDSLSGGEWQRVRIARALAQEAPALVLDEPTTFLDIAHEMAVFELIDALAREGRSIVLVSHQLNLVARFAQQIVLLHAGTVAAHGTVDDVMRGEVLEAVYGWPLVVTRDPAVGAPALLPLRGRMR